MTRRNWKGFTAEDFRKYYEENYSGMSRSRVAKKDTGFYQAIWGKGLVDAVFPKPIRNNWQDFTKEDFQKYYDDNCKGMTRKEVLQANRSFYGAVQRSGLWSYIIPPSRGRWEDWNLEDFKNYYHDNYRGRTRTEISKVESSFVSAAYRKGIADDVFPPVKKKPRGHWKNPTNIQNELEKVIEKLGGRFPTNTELRKANSTLAVALQKHLGGIRKVREEYGGEHDRRSYGYWKNIDNVRKELDLIIEEFGKFPTSKEIQRRNPALLGGIAYHHGGLNKIRGLYGEELPQKPDGYYRDIEKVKEELDPIVEELGRFPIAKELNLMHGSLYAAVRKYHGSLSAVKVKLGYADEELDILKQIVEEAGTEEPADE